MKYCSIFSSFLMSGARSHVHSAAEKKQINRASNHHYQHTPYRKARKARKQEKQEKNRGRAVSDHHNQSCQKVGGGTEYKMLVSRGTNGASEKKGIAHNAFPCALSRRAREHTIRISTYENKKTESTKMSGKLNQPEHVVAEDNDGVAKKQGNNTYCKVSERKR